MNPGDDILSGDRHVCVVGALPPPVHGMAMVTQDMAGALGEQARVTVVNTSPDSLVRGAAYHMRRARRVIVGLARAAWARMRGADTLYMPLSEGLGGIWDLGFLVLARLTGMRVFLHHHSFHYVIDRTHMMATMVAVAGPQACHVVLDPKMDAALRGHYPGIRRSYVAPNPVSDVPSPQDACAVGPLGRAPTVGMLANLTFEKGVAGFVALLDRMPTLNGILAGPAADEEVAEFVNAAVARLHPRLQWRGLVAGAEKEQFFRDIDAFVFPTIYRTEAYPLVLNEAMIRGVPVIAPERGCIGALAGMDAAMVVPLEEDFLERAEQWLTAEFERPDATARRHAVRAEGQALNHENAALRKRLVAMIASCSQLPAPGPGPQPAPLPAPRPVKPAATNTMQSVRLR